MTDKFLSQYNSDVDLYKFYINLVLKLNAFHYAMSAAIFTYLLSNRSEPYLEFILAFPIIFSITIIIIGALGYPRVDILSAGVLNNAKQLGFETYPNFTTLKGLLVASIFTHSLIIIGSVIMLCLLPVTSATTAMLPVQ